jgi:hypothetical protein
MRLTALAALLLAATVVPQSVDQLTDRATLVVRATVLSSKAEHAPGPAGIYTFTRLQVAEALKGSAPAQLTLKQAGGTVGEKSVELPGDARLALGEQVLLFLVCRPAQPDCGLVGLAQGKYHLEAGADGKLVATREFKDTAFVGGAAPSAGPEPFAALAERVRARAQVVK